MTAESTTRSVSPLEYGADALSSLDGNAALLNSESIQSRTLKSVRATAWNADAPSFHTTFLSGQMEEILGFPSHVQKRLRILGGYILKAQHEERSRIARELHDDIGQRLAFVSMDLGRLEHAKMESVTDFRAAIAEVKTQVSEITRDIGALAHDLHSHVLDARGLVSASDDFCRELSARRNISVKFRSERIPAHIPDTTSFGLFRVLQEALQNGVKHSGAKTFEVTLTGSSRSIELSVKDEGQGFDPKEALKGKGLGLAGMEERMKLLGGELSVDSSPSRGTIIRVRVPLDA